MNLRVNARRKATWLALGLFLQFAGAIALLAWLLLASESLSGKALVIAAGICFLLALHRVVATMERRRIQEEIAGMLCTVSAVRTPRWNHRTAGTTTVLRGPAIRALMVEHTQIAQNVESALTRLGYDRRRVHRLIEIGRFEQRMHSYETLFQFGLRQLSNEYKAARGIQAQAAHHELPREPAHRAHTAGH